MSLREWLIAIGTLVIIGIVIDGFRRMRRARNESMAISSGMGADELKSSPLDEDFNPELPNGGARTISRDTLEERGYVKPAPMTMGLQRQILAGALPPTTGRRKIRCRWLTMWMNRFPPQSPPMWKKTQPGGSG